MVKRIMALAILLISTHALPALAATNEDAMPVTNLHRMIAHQQQWLNTSRPLTPDDLKGRIILLDFWTYCCINCMHIIPDLQYLEEKFPDDLTVIGVHSAKFKNERDTGNIRNAILRYGIHHPVVNDFDFTTWKGFGVQAWPTFVLISPMGIVTSVYSGEGHRGELEHDIAQLKDKYAGKINHDKLPVALEQDKQADGILQFPAKLAIGRFGAKDSVQALYISDSGHNRIVVAGLDGKVLETIGSGKAGLKDGDYVNAEFRHPQGVLLNYPYLYVADTENHDIRQVDLTARSVTTIAGTGKQGQDHEASHKPALDTSLASPWDLAFYPDTNHITIAMAGFHQLWSYDIAAKTVSVIAGSGNESIEDGPRPDNALAQTSGLSALGDALYFVDAETSSLRKLEGGKVTTLIGSGLFDFGYKDGAKGTALLQHPLGVLATESGIYVADAYNHSIRRFDVKTGMLSTFAGHGERGSKDGVTKLAAFNEPNAIVQSGNLLYIADTNNQAIRTIDTRTGQTSTLQLTQPATVSDATFSDTLPNEEKLPEASVIRGKPVTVAIGLSAGWHINKDAPSTLALFAMKAKPEAVASFDVEALKSQHITLPALENGPYVLQGTIYYCADKVGSQCLLKSITWPLKLSAKGETTLTITLN